MKKNKVIKKGLIVRHILLTLFIITLIPFIFALALYIEVKNTDYSEPENLRTVIESKEKYKDSKYVKVEGVNKITEYFVEDESDSSLPYQYYFIVDKNNYVYVMKVFFSLSYEYNTIKNNNEQNIETVTITGMTREISKDLKKEIIKAYNEMFDGKILTEENFEKTIGTVYVEEGTTPEEEIEDIVLFMIVTLILPLDFIIIYICLLIEEIKVKKIYKDELDTIEREMEMSNRYELDKINTVLTYNYLVNSRFGILSIIKYSNIERIYQRITTYKNITSKFIVVITKDKKKYNIAFALINRKEHMKQYDFVWNHIIEKVPNVLIGKKK